MDTNFTPSLYNLSPPKARVYQYLEDTLETILAQLTLAEDITIVLKRRVVNSTTVLRLNPSTGALESEQGETTITYSFPGKDAYEAWRFTVALRILSSIYDALQKGLPISIRDIYYTDPEYFESQGVVGRFVDELALTIGVERADLNVEAAAKGLIAGYYKLTTTRGEVIDAREATTECLIPRVQDIAKLDISGVSWILIVEKEAVFRRLARDNFHLRAAGGKGILITGKGYPDLATRGFTRKILDSIPLALFQPGSRQKSSPIQTSRPAFYALVDGDPDGMAIMSTYKYGSMAHTCENASLNVPCLRWLGLRTSEVVAGLGPDGDEALVSLSKRDRRKVISMLGRCPTLAVDGPEMHWRIELQRMLMLNVKAEIEILYDRAGGLKGWIERQMGR